MRSRPPSEILNKYRECKLTFKVNSSILLGIIPYKKKAKKSDENIPRLFIDHLVHKTLCDKRKKIKVCEIQLETTKNQCQISLFFITFEIIYFICNKCCVLYRVEAKFLCEIHFVSSIVKM